MSEPEAIKTKRLILRNWSDEDLEPFARMNADPEVMEYFPMVLNRSESDQLALRLKAKLEEMGWGLWAATLIDSKEFIGFIGLNPLTKSTFPAPFTPAVEIGWRLASKFWGHGLATEGALAALQYGFNTLHLNEVVSFTSMQNMRSRRVMERVGMYHVSQDDFDHPRVPEGHPLRRHVLYRLKSDDWKQV